jgi:hypothetical protein
MARATSECATGEGTAGHEYEATPCYFPTMAWRLAADQLSR